MSDQDYLYVEQTEASYRRVTHLDGVRTTISENRFEICVQANSEVWEQLAVQMLRDWVRWRKDQEELRESGSMPR